MNANPHEQALPIVLSVIAGCTDAIGFFGLGGLFTGHVTGNLVLLSAHIADGGNAQIAQLLAIPVYIGIVGLTTVLAGGLKSIGMGSLRPLLLLQFLLLTAFLVLGVAAGPSIDPNATSAILAGMLGVSAMAVQNTLVQCSLEGMPPTAMMTGNLTRFAIDAGEMLLGREPAEVARARNRAVRTFRVIFGFAIGCGLGAACEATLGMKSLALPAGLALLAFAMGFAVEPSAPFRTANPQRV